MGSVVGITVGKTVGNVAESVVGSEAESVVGNVVGSRDCNRCSQWQNLTDIPC